MKLRDSILVNRRLLCSIVLCSSVLVLSACGSDSDDGEAPSSSSASSRVSSSAGVSSSDSDSQSSSSDNQSASSETQSSSTSSVASSESSSSQSSAQSSASSEPDNRIQFDSDSIQVQVWDKGEPQRIDLTQGATVGGKPVSDTESDLKAGGLDIKGDEDRYPKENWANGEDPQAMADSGDIVIYPESLPIPLAEGGALAFAIEGNTLVVTPDALDSALRSCDDTDVIPTVYEGEVEESDTVKVGDGISDYPTEHTYIVEYYLENDSGQTPHRVEVTVKAGDDLVEDINAPDSLLLTNGETASLGATADPAYACNTDLTYTVDDDSVATVDESGEITAVSTGTTTVTVASEGNHNATKDVSIEVSEALHLTTEADESGTVWIPSCVRSSVRAEPNVPGDYTYSWSSSNEGDLAVVSEQSDDAGTQAVFDGGASNADIGLNSDVTVSLEDTSEDGSAEETVRVEVEENMACNTVNPYSTDNATWAFDYEMESVAYNADVEWISMGPTQETTVPGLIGNGVQLDVKNVKNDKANGMWYRDWSDDDTGFFSGILGQVPESHGTEFKTNVWVKLETSSSEPVVLKQYIHPWQFTGSGDYNGISRRNDERSAVFTAELKNTSEWQYVEFETESGDRTFTVPETWDADGSSSSSVISQFILEGVVPGDSIIFDEYSLIVVNRP